MMASQQAYINKYQNKLPIITHSRSKKAYVYEIQDGKTYIMAAQQIYPNRDKKKKKKLLEINHSGIIDISAYS